MGVAAGEELARWARLVAWWVDGGSRLPGRRRALRDAVRTLNPGSFALVMATAILSIGLRFHGLYALSAALLWLAVACYVVLAVAYGWRIAAFRREVRDDLGHPARAFGFFTVVAGTDVIGTRLALEGYGVAGLTLLAAALLGWLVLGYVVPWTAILGRTHHPVIADANGTWFIWVVATQSVAVLAAALQPTVETGRGELALLAVFCWSVGVFLYAATGILVTVRLLAYPVGPADLAPPYWVAMGATAITVLAGARIVQMADTPIVTVTRGLIAGVAVVFWAFGTWLIPVLLAAGWWRHVVRRVPLRYDATWWSVVFPLGMYGVAAHFLGEADHLPIMRGIGEYEIWIALAVWALAFAAMLAHLASTPVTVPRSPAP